MANEINHYSGYTIRVVGEGNLIGTLYGFDKIDGTEMPPIVMATTKNREPTRVTTFVSQRALLRLEVREINEWFKVNNYTVWIKPLYTSFPDE